MLIIANVNNITKKLYSKFKYEKNDLIAFNNLASEPIFPPKEISGNIIDIENSSKIDKTIAKNIAISNLLGKCFRKYGCAEVNGFIFKDSVSLMFCC